MKSVRTCFDEMFQPMNISYTCESWVSGHFVKQPSVCHRDVQFAVLSTVISNMFSSFLADWRPVTVSMFPLQVCLKFWICKLSISHIFNIEVSFWYLFVFHFLWDCLRTILEYIMWCLNYFYCTCHFVCPWRFFVLYISLIGQISNCVSLRGRSYSPSPPRGHGRRGRSPSPRGRYGGRGRDLPTSLLVRNLRHDCRFVLFNFLSFGFL